MTKKKVLSASKKSVANIVDEFKTEHEMGFTLKELKDLLKKYYPKVSLKKFSDVLGVHTATSIEGESITYHCDVISTLQQIVENRKLKSWEWD